MSTSRSGFPGGSRRLPRDIFRVLADPRRHLEIDGSGMLRGAVSGAAVTGVGDVFTMRCTTPSTATTR